VIGTNPGAGSGDGAGLSIVLKSGVPSLSRATSPPASCIPYSGARIRPQVDQPVGGLAAHDEGEVLAPLGEVLDIGALHFDGAQRV